MRQQGQQNRRNRSRGGRKTQNPLTRNYDSNGPDVKIRGNASHIAEKYTTLARDALSSGDVVAAENLFQHAEHYNRIVMSAQQQSQPEVQPVVQNDDVMMSDSLQEASSEISSLIVEDGLSEISETPKRQNRQGRGKNQKSGSQNNNRRRRRRPNGNGNGNNNMNGSSEGTQNGAPKQENGAQSEASVPVANKPSGNNLPSKTSEAPPDGAIV